MIDIKNERATSDLVEMAHELNRHLFEEDGDAFAVTLADYLRHRRIAFSDQALAFLLDAIEDTRDGSDT